MERLFKTIEEGKDNIFIKNDKGESVTYKETLDYTLKIKEVISERCFVFLFTKNNIGGVLNYVACIKNRIVPFLLSAETNKELVNNLLEVYKPRYIFLPVELKDNYKDYKIVYEDYDYSILRTNYNEEEKLDEDLCMCTSTSGSTGTQKLVRLSYQNIAENTMQGWDFFYTNLERENIPLDNSNFKCLVALPINYSFVLLIINIVLWGGGVVLITERNPFEKEFWEFFVREKANTFHGIPYHCEILNKIGFFENQYPDLQIMIIAGGVLSNELYDKCVSFAKRNKTIFGIGYGQSEATAVISELEGDKVESKKGSIGKGLTGMNLYLIDDAGNKINKPGIDGELVVEGNNIALGYSKDRKDLSKGNEFNKVLYTGDIAVFDEDGYFYIKGRKSRFVKLYGNRINLDDIELLIKKEYKNLDIACVGKDEKIYIFINDEKYQNEVEAFILSKLNLNKKAIETKYMEKIPRNESGKVLYSSLVNCNEK